MGRLVFFLEPLDTPHHGQTWSWWGRERCSGQRQEVTGHTYSCLVSLLPPLHQVAKYWELWHQISKIFTLLPTKSVTGLLMSWLMILLSKYYTEETKPFNLYLFEKRISGSLWFISLCLVWSYQQVITGQNCHDIFHYKWLYYWRKVRFAVSKSI